ncbi:MAG TPA: ATP-binding protein [Actinomycetota bacterium]
MSEKTASRAAWIAGTIAILLTAGQVAFMFVDRNVAQPPGSSDVINLSWNLANVLNALTIAVAVGIAILLVSRRPENRIGWLFLLAALTQSASGFGAAYGVHAIWVDPGSLPAGNLAYWAATWVGLITIMALTLLMIEFPTGIPRTPRWHVAERVVLVGWLVAITGSASFAALNWSHPFDQSRVSGPIAALSAVFIFLIPIVGSFATSIAAMINRYRHATGDERLQLKWFVVGAALFLVTILISIPWNNPVTTALQDAAIIFWFAAIAVAILKYRLYEIDLVINRAVLYGTLAVFITLVYVGLVVGIGTLVGNNRSPLLSAVAAAIVAVAFQPVRQWARKLANRVVYGSRATPYEVLSNFAERIAGTYAAQDVLPQMAQIVAAGTGAERTVVWLRVGDELRAEASSGAAPPASSIPIADGAMPAMPDGEFAAPVTDQGELLGAISVRMPRAEPLSEAGARLIGDVASQAGLVLSNVRLIEELRASRHRIVAAQDQARRRLERNIHDGAQQQLIALALKLRLMGTMVGKDPNRERDLAEQLLGETQEALENLRDLARGIYPPLLQDKGLVSALEGQARKSLVPMTVQADGVDRYSQDVEAAVYFCTLEAMQNAAKYAEATRVTVHLSERDGRLTFDITDDGRGFDPSANGHGSGLQGMSDRLEALGGRLEVRSEMGRGTTIGGNLPLLPETAHS